jgi:hypothetical protein
MSYYDQDLDQFEEEEDRNEDDLSEEEIDFERMYRGFDFDDDSEGDRDGWDD